MTSDEGPLTAAGAVHCDMGLAGREDLALVHRWTEAVLEGHRPALEPERIRDVLIVLAELASNALLHGTGRRRIVLTVDRSHALLEAADDNPAPAVFADGGMGLQVVASLSARCGQRVRPGGGKTVWARVAIG
jgi:two-component sensor histidine kinase